MTVIAYVYIFVYIYNVYNVGMCRFWGNNKLITDNADDNYDDDCYY